MTGVGPGSSVVTATSVVDGSKSAAVTVVVRESPGVVSVSIREGDQELLVSEQVELAAEVVVAGGASTAVTWSSLDPSVVTVSRDGTAPMAIASSARTDDLVHPYAEDGVYTVARSSAREPCAHVLPDPMAWSVDSVVAGRSRAIMTGCCRHVESGVGSMRRAVGGRVDAANRARVEERNEVPGRVSGSSILLVSCSDAYVSWSMRRERWRGLDTWAQFAAPDRKVREDHRAGDRRRWRFDRQQLQQRPGVLSGARRRLRRHQ